MLSKHGHKFTFTMSSTNNNNGNLPSVFSTESAKSNSSSFKSSSHKTNNNSFPPPKTPAPGNNNKNKNDAALSDVASKSVNKPRKKRGSDDGNGKPLFNESRQFTMPPPQGIDLDGDDNDNKIGSAPLLLPMCMMGGSDMVRAGNETFAQANAQANKVAFGVGISNGVVNGKSGTTM